MKYLKINSLLLLLMVLGFSSCLKKDAMNIDPDNTTPSFINIVYNKGGAAIGSGLSYFGNAALIITSNPDTVTFYVGLGGSTVLNKDVTVTLGVDNSKLNDNIKNDNVTYVAMPADAFKFVSTTAVIKAGARTAPVQVVLYSDKMDPTKSYGLPVVVKDAQGYTPSSNFGTLYLHTIGNPLAGSYTVTGTRYNYTGTVAWAGPPASVPSNYTATTNMANGSPKTAIPKDPTTVTIPFANVGAGYDYIITITSANTISVKYSFTSNSSNFETLVKDYNPTTKTIHIITHYNNALDGAGNDRIVDETFVHM